MVCQRCRHSLHLPCSRIHDRECAEHGPQPASQIQPTRSLPPGIPEGTERICCFLCSWREARRSELCRQTEQRLWIHGRAAPGPCAPRELHFVESRMYSENNGRWTAKMASRRTACEVPQHRIHQQQWQIRCSTPVARSQTVCTVDC